MAIPSYMQKAYVGGAKPVDITANVTNIATTITVGPAPLVGWDGLASTPFTLVVNSGLADEEKILCSSVDTSSGIITVYPGTPGGRGYDGTGASGVAGAGTAHSVPSGNPGLTFPVWAGVDAQEANAAAVSVGQIANNSGTSVTPGDVSTTASAAGSSKYAAAYDHIHKFDTSTLRLPTPYAVVSQTGTLTKGTTLGGGTLPTGVDNAMFLLAANVSSTASSDGYIVPETGTSQGWVRVTQSAMYNFNYGCGVNGISVNWGNTTPTNTVSIKAVLLKQVNSTGNWTVVGGGGTVFPQVGTTASAASTGSCKIALLANDRIAVGYRLSNTGTGTLDFAYSATNGPYTYIHADWIG